MIKRWVYFVIVICIIQGLCIVPVLGNSAEEFAPNEPAFRWLIKDGTVVRGENITIKWYWQQFETPYDVVGYGIYLHTGETVDSLITSEQDISNFPTEISFNFSEWTDTREKQSFGFTGVVYYRPTYYHIVSRSFLKIIWLPPELYEMPFSITATTWYAFGFLGLIGIIAFVYSHYVSCENTRNFGKMRCRAFYKEVLKDMEEKAEFKVFQNESDDLMRQLFGEK